MSWAAKNAAQAEVRGDHERAAYWRRIQALVDEAPPLTQEQKARLRILLRPAPVAAEQPGPSIAARAA